MKRTILRFLCPTSAVPAAPAVIGGMIDAADAAGRARVLAERAVAVCMSDGHTTTAAGAAACRACRMAERAELAGLVTEWTGGHVRGALRLYRLAARSYMQAAVLARLA